MSEETPSADEPSSVVEPVETPLLRVVNPDATPEEIAALVAVFSALGSAEAPAKPRPKVWNAPARLVRTSYAHGPGAWRSSALPR